MNQYSTLLYYIKSLADADVFVNTVTQGEQDEIDLDKATIFPLLHINLSTGINKGNTIIYDVLLTCLDIRDTNKEVSTDKFWKQDNEVDNLNETFAVLNKIYLNILRNIGDNNISALGDASFDAQIGKNKNILDGWEYSFQIEIPNNVISIC